MQSVRGEEQSRPAGTGDRLVTAGGYFLLFLLGILQGLVGTFQYSRALGVAVAFAVLIGLTTAAAAWGMRRPLGGLLPAVGWFIAAFILAMGTAGGSVLITNTSPGQWFLFGGSVCAAAGVVFGFVRWSPRRPAAVRGTGRWGLGSPPAGGQDSPPPGGPSSDKPDLGAPGNDSAKPD